jgi:nucleotide-binding universal stress UspA family protein
MRKLLIGVHDKFCSMRAIEYVEKQYRGFDDVEVTLVHVLPNLPAMFWDEGHILSDEEKRERQKVIDTWVTKHKDHMEPIMKSMVAGLVRTGLKAAQIKTKFVLDSVDVADSLLEEAKDGGYQTILLGRCGIQEGKHLLVGSIPSKLIHKAAGLAICIVQ